MPSMLRRIAQQLLAGLHEFADGGFIAMQRDVYERKTSKRTMRKTIENKADEEA